MEELIGMHPKKTYLGIVQETIIWMNVMWTTPTNDISVEI